MYEPKTLAVIMCTSALLLCSCATPGAGGRISANLVSPSSATVITTAPETAIPNSGAEVTVGTLTDPCTLALDDPWWIDHGGRVEFHRRCG
jgi:hypothetical protein